MADPIKASAVGVAVDESLATLLDWTEMAHLNAFGIWIENAGGGSAQALSEIQYDIAIDSGGTLGVHILTDTITLPIASGVTVHENFSEVVPYLRIRGNCAAGEDTTANLWIVELGR